VWAYDPLQNAWGLITPLASDGAHILPGRTGGAIVWDSAGKRAYIYAGSSSDKAGDNLNDCWIVF
jgi:hypothetical protein